MYAFEALKAELEQVDELHFIFTSPTGKDRSASTLKVGYDFQELLTLFSPRSKQKAAPGYDEPPLAPRPEPMTLARPTHSRRRFIATTLTALGWPQARLHAQPAAEDAALLAAIAGPQRSAANRARDAARHPYETLRFFGLAATQSVLELAPGGGWYTEILAPYLREQGQLLVAHYPRDSSDEGSRRSRSGFEAKLAAEPRLYDRVRVGTLPSGRSFTDLALPAGGVDLVLTFRNAHNWLEEGRLDDLLAAGFAALRPGGVLGVVDHRAPAGTPLAQQQASGYLSEALLIEHARGAGFELAARSEINANPRDTHDHPHGVWSLPPTLRGGDTGRERFIAIGESDRFTHRYVKPR
jgi:predicted methyltransferase